MLRSIIRARRVIARGRLSSVLLVVGQLAMCLSTAEAGTRLVTETRAAEDAAVEAQARKSLVWLDGSRLRMEVSGSAKGPEKMVVIFRGDRGLLWALDAEKQSYVQLDKQSVTSLAERLQIANREMERSLAEMPPEQQAQIRQMMKRVNPNHESASAAAPELKVEPQEQRLTIDGKPARRVDVFSDEQRVAEVWLTDWEKLDMQAGDFEAFRGFAAFQRMLVEAVGPAAGAQFNAQGFDVFDQLDGFPLLIRRIEAREIVSETRFRDVVPFDPPKDFFDIPKGYRRISAAGSAGGKQ